MGESSSLTNDAILIGPHSHPISASQTTGLGKSRSLGSPAWLKANSKSATVAACVPHAGWSGRMLSHPRSSPRPTPWRAQLHLPPSGKTRHSHCAAASSGAVLSARAFSSASRSGSCRRSVWPKKSRSPNDMSSMPPSVCSLISNLRCSPAPKNSGS